MPQQNETPTFPFQPAFDYLILLPEEESDSIDIGEGKKLFLPQTGKRQLQQGKVLAKGPTCSDQFHVGDDIIFTLHSEERLQIDRQWFYLLHEENVIAYRSAKN